MMHPAHDKICHRCLTRIDMPDGHDGSPVVVSCGACGEVVLSWIPPAREAVLEALAVSLPEPEPLPDSPGLLPAVLLGLVGTAGVVGLIEILRIVLGH